MSVADRAQTGLAAGTHVAEGAANRLPGGLEDEVSALGQGVRSKSAQTQTIIAGIVIGATLLIGFFVVGTIDDAIPNINETTGNTNLQTDKNDTLDRVGDGLLIGGVVIIVLFAAVILRVLRGL